MAADRSGRGSGPLAVGVALALSTMGSGHGSAASTAYDVPSGMEFNPDTGLLRSDLLEVDAAVAANQGLEYQVTLGRSRAQTRLKVAIEALATTFAGSFGGLQWGKDLSLVAQFKGQVPDQAIQILDAIELPYEIQTVAHTEAELDQLMGDVRDDLGSFNPNDVATAIDPVTQTILVTVSSTASQAQQRPEELADFLSQRTGAQVQVEFTDGPVSIDLAAYGGAELWEDFQTRRCTTGFTVLGLASLTGVATAGHCTPQLPEPGSFYDEPTLTGNYDIALQGSHVGAWGDIAWYTTTGTELDDFYYGNGNTRRDVTGIKNTWAAGDPISWYGRKTNITQANTIFWYNIASGGASRLGCAIGGVADVGDSGGPAFDGSIAAGVIAKKVFINGGWRVCFSQTRYIDEALGGLFIKTT